MTTHRKVGGWVGFDLDGTLAHWPGSKVMTDRLMIGDPIPETVAKAKSLLDEGVDVRILTARIAGPFTRSLTKRMVRKSIEDWTETHLGTRLSVTNSKDHHMWALYDDRAVQVERNTGRILGNPEMLGL